MDREPIATGRLPALGGCRATISSSIAVDLPIPQKPTFATARWWPAWRVASPLRNGGQREAAAFKLQLTGCARAARRRAFQPKRAHGKKTERR